MIPSLNDLVTYINKALTGNDWNTNWQKIVNWLTSGNYDIKVKNLEIATGGSLTNNGNLEVDGNITSTGNVEVDGTITGDGSGLYNLTAQGVQAFTPFCVNKGFTTSGAGDLFITEAVTEGGNITSFKINFKVDSGTTYGKIKATTANGATFELEQITEDIIAADGTYYFFIAAGQNIAQKFKNIKIYRQPTQPANSTNDIWLDTSAENLVCKKCSEAGIWEDFEYVPIGKVVIANIGGASATATATTFAYNQNGYVIISRDDIAPDMATGTTLSVNTDYTDLGTGWVYVYGYTENPASVNLKIDDVIVAEGSTESTSSWSSYQFVSFVGVGQKVRVRLSIPAGSPEYHVVAKFYQCKYLAQF